MEPAFAAIAMPWLYRKAAAFLDTIEIKILGCYLQIKIKAGGILDITESYQLDGANAKNDRRDKRAGHLAGFLQTSAESFTVT